MPFNGDYYDTGGELKNLMGAPLKDTGRPNDSMSPFNGDFYAGDGSVHNIGELSGGGGGGDTHTGINAYSGTILGDGQTIEFIIAHNLNTADLIVQVREIASGETVLVDDTEIDLDTIKIEFAEPPETGETYRICVLGLK